jgi:hypothetical protein
MTRHSKILFALLAAFVVGFSGGAHATSFNLGSVSGPTVLPVGYGKLPGPFTDHYFFSIDPGASLVFSALVTGDTWRHGYFSDFDGTLSDASGVILDGDSLYYHTQNPYPYFQVAFPNTLLGPGQYHLSIFGTAGSDVDSFTSYSGQITLAATPLPPSMLLMLTALGGVGLFSWIRSGKARSAS